MIMQKNDIIFSVQPELPEPSITGFVSTNNKVPSGSTKTGSKKSSQEKNQSHLKKRKGKSKIPR